MRNSIYLWFIIACFLPACFTKTVKKKTDSLSGLQHQMRSSDANMRREAIVGLRRYGENALSAKVALRRAMIQDRSPKVRKAAIYTLIGMGPQAISDWVRGLVSDDPVIKKIANDQFAHLGEHDAKGLAKSLSLPLEKVRKKVLSTLKRLGSKAKVAIPELTKLLGHSEADVKIAVAKAIGQMGADADKAVLKLADALKANKAWWNIQVALANALGQIGPAAAPAAQELAELLQDKDSDVGKAAMAALKQIGPKAIPNLGQVLSNSPWQIKLQLAKLFGSMGGQAVSGVPALARATTDSDTEVRKASVIALGEIGEKAKLGIPALTKILHNQQEEKAIWRETVLALVRIGHAGHKVLLDGLQSKEDTWLQQKIPEALGGLGAKLGRHGVPLLVKALQNPMWQVRWTATMVLQKVKDQSKLAVTALIKALEDTDHRVRKGAAKTLGKYGAKAKNALPALKKLLKDKEPSVQATAQKAISNISND